MKVIKVNLSKEFKVIELHTFSDWHIGEKNCNIKNILEQVEYVKNTPNAYVILNGDLINNATKTSVSDVYAEVIAPMGQLERLVEILEPIKDRILLVGIGNHEARTYRQDGIDLMALLCRELGISDKYVCEGGVLFLRFGELTSHHHKRPVCYTAYVSHGSAGGKKAGGKVNGLIDKACIVDTDIYIIGHTHTPFAIRQAFFRIDTTNSTVAKIDKLFVCTASQLEYGGYGETYGFAPSSTENPVILLDGTRKYYKTKL